MVREDDRIKEIDCPDGEYIRPVCYMNSDLVYGVARQSDVAAATLESGMFPMYKLVILDEQGNIIKNYEPTGMLITGVTKAEHLLSLSRAVLNENGTWSRTDGDEIMDTNTAESVSMGAATRATDRKQTIV